MGVGVATSCSSYRYITVFEWIWVLLMTWKYQELATKSWFGTYNYSQKCMYESVNELFMYQCSKTLLFSFCFRAINMTLPPEVREGLLKVSGGDKKRKQAYEIVQQHPETRVDSWIKSLSHDLVKQADDTSECKHLYSLYPNHYKPLNDLLTKRWMAGWQMSNSQTIYVLHSLRLLLNVMCMYTQLF